ncbi:putative GPI anchor protein [Phytophthora cinnamomi]|uniref:putative GPI anchor protein n=1 Tax=Phytophthora cinnamomi TaxID=4785 RepID=UPI003559F3AD|nr:putative GPI anchor protein [Phytophthora cinnamomi]
MVKVFLALTPALVMAAPVAASVSVTFVNSCSNSISLYDNSKSETIAAGSSTSRELASGYHGMFRDGTDDEATLAEFTISGGYTWYDISVIPPGSGSCSSYEACKELTGKTGYNVAMSIAPDTSSATSVSSSCATLTCESADCSDAYLYPSDTDMPGHAALHGHLLPRWIQLQHHDDHRQQHHDVLVVHAAAVELPAVDDRPAVPVAVDVGPDGDHGRPEVANDYESGTVSLTSTASSSTSTRQTQTSTSTSTSTTSTTSTTTTGSERYDQLQLRVQRHERRLGHRHLRGSDGHVLVHHRGGVGERPRGDWTKVSSYSQNGTQENMVFMNNLNIDYTGADSSPQGYATADGSGTASKSTTFGGSLADASDSSVTGGGPCVSTGCEVNIMTSTNCADEDGCIGYYDDMGFHGWDGGMKMFVTKVQMPTGTSVNRPAIWMLNAQVVRANHVSPGGDNYAARPTDSAVTYVTIIDNSSSGTIKIIELGGDDFDFDVDAVSAAQVTSWISASVENLIS